MTTRGAPIRVLHVVDTLNAGGAERVAVDAVNNLDPKRFVAAIAATRSGGPLLETVRPGVEVAMFERRSRWDPRGAVRLCSFVRRHAIDVVHSHGRGSTELVALCRAAGLIRSRHVFHDHSSEALDSPASLRLRAAVRLGVDYYLGVSQANCAWARRELGLAADRIELLSNGIDLARFDNHAATDKPQLPSRGDDLRVVMVAGLRPVKNHALLLRSLASARSKSRLQVLIVGPVSDSDYFDTCVELTRELGLEAITHYLGGRSDVAAILRECDVGVLTSTSETGPIALAEYMVAGLPFVVTDTGELTNVVREAGAGHVVAHDEVAIADALDSIAEMSPGDRVEMGARGAEFARRTFDHRLHMAQLEAVYTRLLTQDAR